MTNWLLRYAQAHPGRLTVIGFLPALVYLVWLTAESMRTNVWMGLLMVPLTLGAAAVMVACGRLAELGARLGSRGDDD